MNYITQDTGYVNQHTRWSNKSVVPNLWFLSEFMSYTAGILWETGAAWSSWVHGFVLDSMLFIASVLCVVYFVVFVFVLCLVVNAANCPFGFLYRIVWKVALSNKIHDICIFRGRVNITITQCSSNSLYHQNPN